MMGVLIQLFNGRSTGYRYDALDRVSTIDYPRDADVTTTYTDSGQRASVIDGRGTSTYRYDAEDRLERKADADGGLIEYRYDRNGNLISRVSPSQSLVYTYDDLNRLETVTRTVEGEAPTVTRYEYDAVGNRKAMLGADGIRTEYGYDRRHRLRSLVKTTAAGALMVGMAYAVDASGMRTSVVETDGDGTSRTVAWAYDDLKRLTRETIVNRDPARSRTTAWTYDKVGNRLTQVQTIGDATPGAAAGATEVATTYTYDRNDRLLTETADNVTTTYTYDDNGNTLTKSTPADRVEYAYDDANRLVEMKQGGARTTYRYDADGLRVGQTHFPVTGPFVTTSYVQDPTYAYSQVIEEYVSENGGAKRIAATFTFADDLIAQTRHASAPTGSLTQTTASVHQDGFGSTRWLTDAAGGVTDSIEYDAFGATIARTGTADVAHLYRSEQFDPNLGFYYLRARYYDARSGRFSSMDAYRGSMSDPASLHKYGYGNADPVNYSDPSGKNGILAGLGVSMTVGAILGMTSTYLANEAMGRATYAEDYWHGAKIGASLGALTYACVWCGVGLGMYGVHQSGALVADVYLGQPSTTRQKAAATVLLATAVFGTAAGGRIAAKAGPMGKGNGLLHDYSVKGIATFLRALGAKVVEEVHVKNPFYSRGGRIYDFAVKIPGTDRWIGFEYKSSFSEYLKYHRKQTPADEWINEQGGPMIGKRAIEAGAEGEIVSSVIRINGGRTTPTPCQPGEGCE